MKYAIRKNTYILFIGILVLLSSCNTTKYVAEDDYLLKRVEIDYNKKKLNKNEVKSYLKQTPNKRILGFRFHLWLYNLSGKSDSARVNQWLRRIGEAPVVYDRFLTERSKRQLELYLRHKGYYNAIVNDSVNLANKRAKVLFSIQEEEALRIAEISYSFSDSLVAPILLNDTINSLIKRGNLLDSDKLQEERVRIERTFRELGYYRFSRNYINYEVDSTLQKNYVSVQVRINPAVNDSLHRKYIIREVNIFPNFDQKKALSKDDQYMQDFDTTMFKGLLFYMDKNFKISREVLNRSCFLRSGDYYNLENFEQTNRHLNQLQLFKFVSIQFNEDTLGRSDTLGYLQCNIFLTPQQRQSYTIESELTNSGGNLGIAGNVGYQHKNLFHGAELIDWRFRGAIEAISENTIRDLTRTMELGTELKFQTPRFVLPFKLESFFKDYSPKTQYSMAFNYQDRPYYSRDIVTTSFGYNWKGKREIYHTFNLLDVNFVNLRYINQDWFDEQIAGRYQENSFQDHLVTYSGYNLLYSSQKLNKRNDFFFLKFNIEAAGNLLMLYNEIFEENQKLGEYTIMGEVFSQYLRSDIDFSFHQILNESNELVYRVFAGAALPYGNSNAIPFEKKYFVGGANSLRAWGGRTLGPGTYSGEVDSRFPNQTADIKLEANFEYRFKLFWKMEGALFMDVGNIWSILEEEDREGAVFKANNFYKQLAVGTGFGTRFDFQFFIFRIDMGIKMRDPRSDLADNWIIGNRKLDSGDVRFNIGIGYPF